MKSKDVVLVNGQGIRGENEEPGARCVAFRSVCGSTSLRSDWPQQLEKACRRFLSISHFDLHPDFRLCWPERCNASELAWAGTTLRRSLLSAHRSLAGADRSGHCDHETRWIQRGAYGGSLVGFV